MDLGAWTSSSVTFSYNRIFLLEDPPLLSISIDCLEVQVWSMPATTWAVQVSITLYSRWLVTSPMLPMVLQVHPTHLCRVAHSSNYHRHRWLFLLALAEIFIPSIPLHFYVLLLGGLAAVRTPSILSHCLLFTLILPIRLLPAISLPLILPAILLPTFMLLSPLILPVILLPFPPRSLSSPRSLRLVRRNERFRFCFLDDA